MPTWVVLSAATAIALGTYVGGWRIIKTMGSRIIKMDPAQGFAAQGTGAAVILSASHVGFPLSTTHVITGAIMGAGAAKRLSAVRWGVAGNIGIAWALTLPASAAVGGLTYAVVSLFGTHKAGPVVVSLLLLTLLTAAFIKRVAGGRTADGGGLDARRHRLRRAGPGDLGLVRRQHRGHGPVLDRDLRQHQGGRRAAQRPVARRRWPTARSRCSRWWCSPPPSSSASP